MCVFTYERDKQTRVPMRSKNNSRIDPSEQIRCNLANLSRLLFQVSLFPTPNDLAYVFSLHDRIILDCISKGVRLVCGRNKRICRIQWHEKNREQSLSFSKFLQLNKVPINISEHLKYFNLFLFFLLNQIIFCPFLQLSTHCTIIYKRI